MKIELDFENMYGDDITKFVMFLSDLSTDEVLEFDRLVSEERNRRIEKVLKERAQA